VGESASLACHSLLADSPMAKAMGGLLGTVKLDSSSWRIFAAVLLGIDATAHQSIESHDGPTESLLIAIELRQRFGRIAELLHSQLPFSQSLYAMNRISWICLTLCWLVSPSIAQDNAGTNGVKKAIIDLASVKDPATLETVTIQDWTSTEKYPTIRQKLIEITVCEWWPGQKVRLPVTLLAPVADRPCENVIVSNMGLALKPAIPTGSTLKLLQEKGVGVVLVGMSTIDTMEPKGELHLGMKRQLLATKNARFTPAWIWGMSDMRALTAAIAEKDVFQPKKVLATGGSKRGVAAAVAGLHDPRFTAILPVVAPPLGNPGGAYVVGTENVEVVEANQAFLAALENENPLKLPEAARKALIDRQERRNTERISLDEARAAKWNENEALAMNDVAWDICRIAPQWDALKKRGLAVFYNVGTNDSVSPKLVELGNRFPQFPIYIVPGGQHGGPKDSGFTRQVPAQKEVESNLYAFASHHFFESRPMVESPKIGYVWDSAQRKLRVSATFPKDVVPDKNEVSWSVNRHAPYTLAFEYDSWETIDLPKKEATKFSAEFTLKDDVTAVEFVTTHTHTVNDIPLSISSPLIRIETR
jgi:hypothetical protein